MLSLAAQSLMTLHGSGAQPAWSEFYEWLTRYFPEAAPLVGLVYALSIPLLDLGGTLEELGWRGFALPHLEKRMPSSLAATLVLGAL